MHAFDAQIQSYAQQGGAAAHIYTNTLSALLGALSTILVGGTQQRRHRRERPVWHTRNALRLEDGAEEEHSGSRAVCSHKSLRPDSGAEEARGGSGVVHTHNAQRCDDGAEEARGGCGGGGHSHRSTSGGRMQGGAGGNECITMLVCKGREECSQ